MGGSIDFYSVSAQVIPVLILVVLLEQRAVRRLVDPLAALLIVLAAVLAASVGEIVALRELYVETAAPNDQYFVLVPLGFLGLVIVAPVVGTSLRAVEAAGGRVRIAAAWVALLFVGWAVAIALLGVTR